MGTTTGRRWSNWAGNMSCVPASVHHPVDEDELVMVVKEAAALDQRVKVVGSGHSFTGTALTDGRQIQLDRYGRVLAADADTGLVTVEAGITLGALNDELARRGLALENLGDIAYQTISGAIATATHGTGARLGVLSTQVRGLRLVTGDGSIIDCSSSEEPEVFSAARVGLGSLGAVSTVTLQCLPDFKLHAVEEPMRLDAVLEDLDALVAAHDHFEFFWVPHTGWALTKRNDRTNAPLAPRSRWQSFRDDVLLSNIAFGALCRLGRLRPSLVPRLVRALPSTGRVDYVDRSDAIFASPRYVHFTEMEWAVPRAAAVEAVRAVQDYVKRSGLMVGFPVEVRFVAGDDIPLSPASGRDTCYVAVHMYQGVEYAQYFSAVEDLMTGLGGRPHWGKLHFQTASTLAPRYPGWDAFRSVRQRVDPEGRFANDYTERVLGPVS